MKTVVVTGASSGIGAKIVEVLHSQDWQVIMVARNEERLKKLQSQFAGTQYEICDLSQPQQIDELLNRLPDTVDALVNNAGVYIPSNADNDSDQVWLDHFNSNLMSAVRITRGLWPKLKTSKGTILNISSTLAVRPIPNALAYSALKAAMNNWTLGLALEGAKDRINVNAICPGLIDTPIHSFVDSDKPEDKELYDQMQFIQPLGRTGKPADVAHMAAQLLASESQWITGQLINVDGGILLNS